MYLYSFYTTLFPILQPGALMSYKDPPMGHFDQYFNFTVSPTYAANPADREKLCSIMNKYTEELVLFDKAHPTTRRLKPNVGQGTKSKSSAASGKKLGAEKDSEKVISSKPKVIISSYTTDLTTEIKITVKNHSKAKRFHIEFDIDA